MVTMRKSRKKTEHVCPDTIICAICTKEKPWQDYRYSHMTKTGRGITCLECQQRYASLSGYIEKGTKMNDLSSFTIEMEADNYGLTDEEKELAQAGVAYFIGEKDMSLLKWLQKIGVPDDRQTKIMSITASLAKETCNVPRARSR